MTNPAAAGNGEPWADRLVWIFGFNLREEGDVAEIEATLAKAAASGLNGVVLSAGLDWLIDRPAEFNSGLDRVIEACRKHDLEIIPAGFSFGYGNPFLGRDPNLAEGLPVKDALFIVGEDGTARLEPDPPVAIVNGGFEEHDGDTFPGYQLHDAPGQISFADSAVYRSGACSIRLENFDTDKYGHGRVSQRVRVHPFRSYRVSVWVRTEGLKPRGCFRMIALAPGEGERDMLTREFDIPETGDWRQVTAVFNSSEFSEVTFYCGIWEGQEGKVWLDDWKIEELGPQHVLRRPGTPVRVKSENGKIVYREDSDYAPLRDPDMNVWQLDSPVPDLRIIPGGRIKPGDRLKVSWYHPMIIYQGQVGSCMAEPAIYEIAEKAAKAMIERFKPRRVLLNMDEIRTAGTCHACGGKNAAKLLGQSVMRIARILRKYSPDLEIYIWSDMFDPYHNARPRYFHVEGDYSGSWQYLSRDIVITIWGGKLRAKSFEFFKSEGFQVMGACYYDAKNLDEVKEWVEAGREYGNVRGFMYTTWDRKYDLLPGFCELLKQQP